MNIVGLNFFHADTSASIIKDNKIIAASEEERFARVKHFSGFPIQSLDFCLKSSNLKINEIDMISVNSNPFYNIHSKILFSLKNPKNFSSYFNRLSRLYMKTNINDHLYQYYGNTKKIKLVFVPHHISHSCASVFTSGQKNGLAISFDAAGDFSTFEVYDVNNLKFKKIGSLKFPHSLGILYQALTQYLGFKDYGDEYKVMGLAAYGEPRYLDELKKLYYICDGKFKLNLKYFTHHQIGFNFNFKNNYPFFENLYSTELLKLLGPERNKNEIVVQKYKDIASSLQKTFENIFLEILKFYKNKTNHENLFLSGGCAFNALNNKFIAEQNLFKSVFIHPNSGDAGGGLGSALYTNFKYNKNFQQIELQNMYLGPKEKAETVSNIINKEFKNKQKEFLVMNYKDKDDLIYKIAQDLSDGCIIAWHQGRMEFGPRALGNRSILAHPGIKNIKDVINSKIKNREEFRPFAPSVLKEYSDEFFNLKKSMNYNFMNVICGTKSNKSNLIPAVINTDNTSRPQLVSKNSNEIYYNLIYQFFKLTNIPLLLNTSLNIEEPICCSSIDTISCFLRSDMDVLGIENFYIKRIRK